MGGLAAQIARLGPQGVEQRGGKRRVERRIQGSQILDDDGRGSAQFRPDIAPGYLRTLLACWVMIDDDVYRSARRQRVVAGFGLAIDDGHGVVGGWI